MKQEIRLIHSITFSKLKERLSIELRDYKLNHCMIFEDASIIEIN